MMTFINFPAYATDPATATSERIKGVSKFLLDRAEDNFLYVFEKKIEGNKYFECYFPNTHYYVASGDLKTLLISGKDVWKSNVELDFQALLQFYVISQLGEFADEAIMSIVKDKLRNELKTNLGDKLNDLKQEIDVSPLDTQTKLELQNLFAEYLLAWDKLDSKIEALAKTIEEIIAADGKISSTNIEEVDRCFNTPKWRTARENPWHRAYKQLKEIAKNGKKLFLKISIDNKNNRLKFSNIGMRLELVDFVKDKLSFSWWLAILSKHIESEYGQLIQNFEQHVKTILEVANSKRGAVVKFLELERVLKEVERDVALAQPVGLADKYFLDYFGRDRAQIRIQEEIEKRSKAKDKSIAPYLFYTESTEYQKMRTYVMFFAQLSDAENAEEVQAVLKSVTLPSVSFGLKRKPAEYHVLLSSYLGVTLSETESQQNNFFGTLMAPIGIEWSRGCQAGSSFICPGGGSFSLMVAPVDFSHPINLELKEVSEEVSLDDIYVIGIYAAWGLKDLPIAIGAGWQRGRSLVSDSGEDEDRVLMFLALDMPLYLFH